MCYQLKNVSVYNMVVIHICSTWNTTAQLQIVMGKSNIFGKELDMDSSIHQHHASTVPIRCRHVVFVFVKICMAICFSEFVTMMTPKWIPNVNNWSNIVSISTWWQEVNDGSILQSILRACMTNEDGYCRMVKQDGWRSYQQTSLWSE